MDDFDVINSKGSNELQSYGKKFQYKMVYLLLTDKVFFERLFTILDPTLFSSDSVQWIVKKLKDHYNDFKELPDVDNFKIYITQEIENKSTKINVVHTLKKIYEQRRTNNTDLIKKTATDFFKNQNLGKAIFECVDLWKDKRYEEIRNKINKALTSGEEQDVGLSYIEDIDERYEEMKRDTISFGYKILDKYTGGGIAGGELAVIVAPSGTGKTFLMNHMALRMLREGKKVVYYNLEDNKNYIALRLDSILMKDSTQNMRNRIDELKEKISKDIRSNIYIQDFPSQITNVNHLISHYDRLKLLHFHPDVIFVDYGDILGSVHPRQQDWLDQKQKFEELKSMAQQLEIPIITAGQANKQSLEKNIVEAQDIQRAYSKVAPCNIILGFSRHVSDKLNNTGRIHFAKNKYGPDGITLPANINYSDGTFKMLDPETKRGRELLEAMKENNEDFEAGKGRLRKHLKEFI